jgi:oligogalacturonide lyase
MLCPKNLSARLALSLIVCTIVSRAGFAQDSSASPSPTGSPEPSAAASPTPPVSWVDAQTGHRVIRLTTEPGSDSFYFNFNPFTPDGKRMVYTTKDGISVLDLATYKSTPLVKGPAKTIIVAHKSPVLYFTRGTKDPMISSVWKVNIDTGVTEKIADLPRRASVVAINADETLGAGTFIEGDANAGGAYDGTVPSGRMTSTNLGEPVNKGEMMEKRLAAKLPMTLFTINLKTGKIKPLIQHSTDWLNHLQFSPADPALLMYCHEGPWQKVDRIWLIHTDGTHNELVHKRTQLMELAGHEWWGADGETIFYQLHFASDEKLSYVASYNIQTHERIWRHYDPDASSIHDNSSPDGTLFCGDGDNSAPWIVLLRPTMMPNRDTKGDNLIKPGYLKGERLVDMSKQNYRLEPNPIFTPDQKYIIFRSNMFGPDYAFAVEVAKAGSN